jgi:hypothetical protein
MTSILLLALAAAGQPVAPAGDKVPRAVFREAPLLRFPADTDCNSPSHWSNGTFYIFISAGHPKRSSGSDLFHLGPATPSKYDSEMNGGRWIECTWKEEDGTLWGWYHNEPGGLCPGTTLTAPRIGAVSSKDDGANLHDLGLVLEARPAPLRCDAKNGFFAGGNGDFSVMLDEKKEWLYFLFSAYSGEVSEQGVAVARMAWADRASPAGKVLKWHRGEWKEPGLGGRLTPVFPAALEWARFDPDAFWGPSIHRNTHLGRYVVLMNRTKDRPKDGPPWFQEGVYVSFADDLSKPEGWTKPVKIYSGGGWYPLAVGIDTGRLETDKLAGRVARFFLRGADNIGESRFEVLFLKPGESP